jgi:hypothetical protein
MDRTWKPVKDRFDNSRCLAYVPRPTVKANEGGYMYVWSKRLVIGLLIAFTVFAAVFFIQTPVEEASALSIHTTRWILLNYAGLVIWVFVWMFDQARVRGKSLAMWFVPFVFAPLPTLMLFVLVLQRRLK